MQVKESKIEQAFFHLVQAGLWERGVQLLPFGEIDFSAVFDLAEDQSVAGIVAAGIEHVDTRPAKRDVIPFIGYAVQLEQRNREMNCFIRVIVEKMNEAGIETLLVKGQGVGQCYERPLWRSCGDVDFFLSEENYERAKAYLIPLATSVKKEFVREKHLELVIDSWVVELHGSLYCGLSRKIERELDEVYYDSFVLKNRRCWNNDDTEVPLLAVENDVFYTFSHILQHFYKGGIGLRQICDWCRLLWTYNEVIDYSKLVGRLQRARMITMWKAFGAFAVEWLGMDSSALPLYSDARKWKRKANRIKNFVIMSGNFGHNRDSSYFLKFPYLIRKIVSFGIRLRDITRHAFIFPIDSLLFMPRIVINGLKSAANGE